MSLPSGYKRLEYIQSSGTQHIYTGVTVGPSNYNKIKFSVTAEKIGQGTGSSTSAWMTDGASNSSLFYIGVYNNLVYYGCGTQDVNTGISYSGGKCTFTLDAKNEKVSVTGHDDTSATIGIFSNTVTLYLCAFDYFTIRHFAQKLYGCQIYEDDVLVRDFIPCKTTAGIVGLWDDVNSVFYGNAGTGTFTAGPEVGVSTPANFRLSSSTETTATLAWDAVDEATGYKLYRDGTLIATLTDTSYTDVIQPFVSYVYTLTAYNANGESDPATISVQIIIPPETPSNFRVVSKSIMEISLAWDAVTGADSYQLKRNGSVIYSGEGTSYTDGGLTAGTDYTYTLSAVNMVGSSVETMLEAATTKFILVTDRTAADVAAQNAKGTYNASDLNRVGAAMNYVADRLTSQGYAVAISPKTDWQPSDWPTPQTMEQYLDDLNELRRQFTVMESTPKVPADMVCLTVDEANDIEKILEDIDLLLTNIAAGWLYSGEIYSGEV